MTSYEAAQTDLSYHILIHGCHACSRAPRGLLLTGTGFARARLTLSRSLLTAQPGQPLAEMPSAEESANMDDARGRRRSCRWADYAQSAY